MIKPFSNKLLNWTLLILELAFMWVLIWEMWNGPSTSAPGAALGAAVILFVFGAHLIAIALQYVVPKFPTERHNFAVLVCILGSILLALMLTYGMFISVIYLNPQ